VYDIYCENEKGEKFIVELQKARQDFFKERTIFYSTFPIREQAEKGEWDFNLSAVYCIGILDFVFRDRDHSAEEKEVIHYIKLKDQYCRVFYDKLMYVYIEMPKFTKQPHELETRLDKWLYFIRHLEDFQSIPEIFKNEVVFLDLLDKATIAAFNQSQLSAYEDSLKAFRDIKNVEDSAFREGLGQGVVQGIVQVAAQMKAKGFDIATICDVTGLSAGEVSLL